MATRSAKIDQKADLIWAIADKLTGVYKPHEYGDVILPLTVIRRFDCILSDTKDAVLQKYDEVKNLPMKDILLRKASKKDFYNTSKYTFERLMDDPDHIEENFREYLNKFSANVRDILEKFKFDGHITTMANKGILYIVLKEYTTDRGNLHPNEISNLEMGYIFEEIIRRFSESHNEDAGQHYTPREVIQLMVNILFYDDNDILSGNNVAKTIYDPACGTGGMLSVELESTEGGYTPISGDSGHREPKKDPLTVIIDKINEKYGTHFTEMDKVLVQMENDYANQEKWQSYAKNNDRATFMLLFEKDFPNMAADRYEQNDQFFRKLFDDPDMMRQVMETVGSVLYERLKKKYIFDPKSGVIEEATPETYVEDTYLTKK